MKPSEAYCLIQSKLRLKENYVPRTYETIGGMWTVDTWKLGDVTYNLTEGDCWITNGDFKVREDYSGHLHFTNGTEEDLITLAESL